MINPILQCFRENLAEIAPNHDNKEKLSGICHKINDLIKDNPQLLQKLDKTDICKLNRAISIIGYMQLEEKVRVEILKTFAVWDGRGISQNIHKFGITDQNVLMEIAKIVAVRNTKELAEFINNYGITDQDALIELANIVAHAKEASRFIHNFRIIDENERIKIAKIAAAQNGRIVSENIQKYGITDQRALIEIAKIAAAQSGWGLSLYIQNYGIKDEHALIEIAKIAAAQSGCGLSDYIQNYGITDQNVLIEIAKIAAAKDGMTVSFYIQKYGITDQRALIEIAKIAAAQSGFGLSLYIQKYGITDQRALIEIAKIAAAQSGCGVSEYIQNYGITDQNALIEIMKIAVKDPNYEMKFTKNFGPMSEVDRFMIAGVVACNSPIQIRDWLKQNPFEDSGLQKRLECYSLLLNKIDQNQHEVEEEDIPEKLQPIQGILESALKYRNTSLAKALITEAIIQTLKPGYMETVLEITKGGETHKQLLSVIPAKWMIESVMPAKWMIKDESSMDLCPWMNTWKPEFRNKSSSLQQQYLLTVMILDQVKGILPERKLQLLNAIMSQENLSQVLSGLRLMQTLCVVHAEEGLSTLNIEDLMPEMTRIFETSLSEDHFRGLSHIENVAQKYQETFGNMRSPYAFDSYLANLRTLPEMQEPVERFGTSVLLRTFSEERMRTDNNPHLQKIAEYDISHGTEILSSWNTLSPEVYVTASEKSEISFRDFFQNKSQYQHWHIDKVDQFPELTAYLATGEKLQNQDPKKQTVIDACISLIENPQDPQKRLEIISSRLGSLKLKLEFQNDIKGLIKTLNAPTQSTDSQEKVEICRGWEDLFLCGTEVEGSCQRIDGNIHLNKCLLAYCLDGKISMIAIKNEEGKIVARAILKLLWDEETGKPAIFLERCYPDACSSSRKKGIEEMAIAFAKELDCSLFTEGTTNVALTSFGSSCPYEYEDGVQGVQEEGKFMIKKALKIV